MAKHQTLNPSPSSIDQHWDFDKPSQTEAAFKTLLSKARQSVDQPGNHTYQAVLLTQLARTQSLQLRIAEAQAYLDQAKPLLREAQPLAAARFHLEQGRTYNSDGKKTEASLHFKKAFALARENGLEYHAVDAAHMLGISEAPEQQLAWSRKAMEMAESASDPKAKKWLGPLYNNIGWTYHDLGKLEEALHLFQKSLEWRKAKGDAKGQFVAEWTIGRCLRSLGQHEQALQTQRALLQRIESGQAEANGYVYEELAECLVLLGRPEKARTCFAQAHALLNQDPWLKANEAERLERLRRLGTV